MSYLYIDTQSAFDSFFTELENNASDTDDDYIALDTEFMRDRSYYSKLALLQITSKETTAIIDPLPLDNMDAFGQILSNPKITKVVHSGTQDIEIFYYLFDTAPKALFDTQIAATALGLGNQVGYADLVNRMLGKSLSKAHTRTNWLDRPLKTGQLEYAADDVIYLYQLYPLLCAELEAMGRTDWLTEDLAKLMNPDTYAVNFKLLWRKVKGHQRLRGVQLSVLDALARWREQLAMKKDRPRKFIIKDEAVLDLIRHKPDSPEQCRNIRNFPKFLSDTQLKELLQLIQAALEKPQDEWPSLPTFAKLDKQQESVIDTLMAIVKWAAVKNQISTDTLGTRKDIEHLLRHQASADDDSPLLKGWRYENAGRYLQAFLNGNASLRVVDSALTLEIHE